MRPMGQGRQDPSKPSQSKMPAMPALPGRPKRTLKPWILDKKTKKKKGGELVALMSHTTPHEAEGPISV